MTGEVENTQTMLLNIVAFLKIRDITVFTYGSPPVGKQSCQTI